MHICCILGVDKIEDMTLLSLRLIAGGVQPEKRRLQVDFIAAFQYLKGATEKMGRDSWSGSVVVGQGVMVLK